MAETSDETATAEQWQIEAMRENEDRVAEIARTLAVPPAFAERLLDVEMLCHLTLAFTPDTDAVMAEQRVAISVLDALGLPFDRESYLARLAAANPILTAVGPDTSTTDEKTH